MTLSAYKKRITVGAKLRVENYRFPHMSGDRSVIKVQGNAFVTEHPTKSGSGGVWMYWPKAALIKPIDESSFEVIDDYDGKPFVKFSILEV